MNQADRLGIFGRRFDEVGEIFTDRVSEGDFLLVDKFGQGEGGKDFSDGSDFEQGVPVERGLSKVEDLRFALVN